MLKKILMGLIVSILVLVGVLLVGKNIIAKKAITSGVKLVTGLDMKIDSMNIGVMNSLIGIRGLKLFNPAGFEDKLMVDLPEIFIDYDLDAFMKKQVHLEEVRLDLKEFIVVKNKDGGLNLDSLKAVQIAKEERPAEKGEEKPKGKGQIPEIQIDKLKLKIGKVLYKDYSKGTPPQVKEFNVNIDAEYNNITDPQALARIIVLKALANTTIANLANFDLRPLTNGLKGTVKDAGKIIQDISTGALVLSKDAREKSLKTTQETVKETAKKLKKLLPFGK